MSRAHIVEMLERALSLGSKECVRLLAPEIERLLADEREPMECGHPRACWVELKAEAPDGSMQGYAAECSACAEREKVREMCAAYVEGWINHQFKWRDAAPLLADEIRQLDLTAPSTEEGGDAK
ncbi:hypothetical protein LCGC14_2519240 [marine sediment metagenome]|uniref:Uncharacterized protein n=1 Tax=marine sediment metagenome TaxID=412755 RepID=A0A0F9AXB0_9ZZZZ